MPASVTMTGERCDEGRIAIRPPDCPELIRAALDVTGFQRDLLAVVASTCEPHPSGQTVRRAFEDVWDTDVNESRVYQNLEKLKQADLVATYPIDGRTKGYRVTENGRDLMSAYCSWVAACLAEDSEEWIEFTASVGETKGS